MGVDVILHNDSPSARWAGPMARALVTARGARKEDQRAFNDLALEVSRRILHDLPLEVEEFSARAHDLAAIVAALTMLADLLAATTARAEGVDHSTVLAKVFAVLEDEGWAF